MTEPLFRPASSSLKLNRANCYADELMADVWKVVGEEQPSVGLAREYDRKNQAVVFRADRVPEVRDNWGLILGDAIHNYRCALDHLWWALATKNLGREPTEKEARSVQFPIIDNATDWLGHRYLKHVDPRAVDEIELLQEFNGRYELSRLAYLSNRDKHRLIQPAVYVTQVMSLDLPATSAFIDCRAPTDFGAFIRSIQLESIRPKLGDVAMRIPVAPTGPNPDLDYQPKLAGAIVVGEDWEIDTVLGEIQTGVAKALTVCQRFL